MDSAIIILPALIRLLYATGLRISEALSLKEKDVNTDDHYLVVRDSKNGQERMIPISLSLSAVLHEYHRHKRRLPLSGSISSNFFVTLAGGKCNSDHVRKWFKKVLWDADVSKSATGMRLHDLRHTFSIQALAMMAESGIDLYCSLPVLSTYLGHQSLEATNAYVRLTSAMFPGLLKDVDFICLNVFPKTNHYATY
jgi:integrase